MRAFCMCHDKDGLLSIVISDKQVLHISNSQDRGRGEIYSELEQRRTERIDTAPFQRPHSTTPSPSVGSFTRRLRGGNRAIGRVKVSQGGHQGQWSDVGRATPMAFSR